MANQNESNRKKVTIHFKIAIHRGLHERRNITASFTEQLKFQEKMTVKTRLLLQFVNSCPNSL